MRDSEFVRLAQPVDSADGPGVDVVMCTCVGPPVFLPHEPLLDVVVMPRKRKRMRSVFQQDKQVLAVHREQWSMHRNHNQFLSGHVL